jgi:hypothetical protein
VGEGANLTLICDISGYPNFWFIDWTWALDLAGGFGDIALAKITDFVAKSHWWIVAGWC